MWCIKCQADVAAEMAPDNRRILCASCGSQLRSVPLLPTEDKTQKARELLQRWSKNKWTGDSEDTDAETPEPKTSSHVGSRDGTKASLRVDDPHLDQAANSSPLKPPRDVEPKPVASKPIPQVSQASQTRLPQSPPSLTPRTHEPHGFSAPPPHFPGEPLDLDELPPKSSSAKMQAFWGQMMAYAGVLALTVGAAFVLMGYFGEPRWQSYAPTGWLITITGQMLLFLGVVTLVSGGMEQTTEEVVRRIDKLGQRMIRIEWASQNHALKGPSLPAEQFLPGGAPHTQSQPVPANTIEG